MELLVPPGEILTEHMRKTWPTSGLCVQENTSAAEAIAAHVEPW